MCEYIDGVVDVVECGLFLESRCVSVCVVGVLGVVLSV